MNFKKMMAYGKKEIFIQTPEAADVLLEKRMM